ncbi:MAG: hypothetical protein AVO33_06815 [delta proteobacterium ML8_F1]|nr:MAG: hypothetical protein AVO33_06815 [delta proteobacterium ML8_F1]
MIDKMTKIALTAALYATLTLALAPISYGNIQFRLSEVLTLLAFYNPVFIPGITLGTFIANLFSPLGTVDVIFGTLATFLSVVMISRTRNFYLATLWPTLFNGVIIGWELNLVFGLPLMLSMFQVAAGEFVVVSLLGTLIFKKTLKNHRWLREQ